MADNLFDHLRFFRTQFFVHLFKVFLLVSLFLSVR